MKLFDLIQLHLETKAWKHSKKTGNKDLDECLFQVELELLGCW